MKFAAVAWASTTSFVLTSLQTPFPSTFSRTPFSPVKTPNGTSNGQRCYREQSTDVCVLPTERQWTGTLSSCQDSRYWECIFNIRMYVCIQRNLSKVDSHLSASCKRPLIKRCCIVEVDCNGLLLCSAVLGREVVRLKRWLPCTVTFHCTLLCIHHKGTRV